MSAANRARSAQRIRPRAFRCSRAEVLGKRPVSAGLELYLFWYIEILSWTVETLNETVDAEVEALPEDMRARLARIAKLIEEKGLERVASRT